MKKTYPFALPALAALLALYTMLRSTYLTGGAFPSFAAGLVIAALMLISLCRLTDGGRALRGAALAAVLSIANMCALPMLYYTDGFPPSEVTSAANSALLGLVLVCLGALGGALFLYVLERTEPARPIAFPVCTSLLTLLTAAAVLLLSDRSSGTTLIMGMQAAIPAAAVLLLAAAAAVRAGKLILKLLCGLSLLALTAALVIRNETGIPALTIGGLIIWYLFFSKKKHRALTALAIAVPAMAAGGVVFLKYFGDSLRDITLVDKVMTRLFSGNVEQAASARRSLSQSGIFGTNSYMYLSEGTSDFCIVTLTHYLGLAFLALVMLAAVPFLCVTALELMKSRSSAAEVLASMSLCLLMMMLIYNLLMCCGLVPIVGVQAPFVGDSKLFSLLSGLLLGWSCYSTEDAEKVRNKINEVRSELNEIC